MPVPADPEVVKRMDEMLNLLADAAEMTPIGMRLRCGPSLLLRTGKLEFVCIDGAWEGPIEKLKAVMKTRGIHLIDRRQPSKEEAGAMTKLGLELVDHGET